MPSRPQWYGVYLNVKERCLNKHVNGDESDSEAYWERFPILQERDDLQERRPRISSGRWRPPFTVSAADLQFPTIVSLSRFSGVQPYRRCMSSHRRRRPMFE